MNSTPVLPAPRSAGLDGRRPAGRGRTAAVALPVFLLLGWTAWPAGAGGSALPDAGRRVEIAGNPLVAAPDFEFVRAFSANAAIHGAIDPALHPQIIGRTVDVYVVASRSAAAWIDDRSLVDVRGEPEAVTFTGTSLRDDVFQVAEAGQLVARVGASIGVGYDLVIDLDRDGLLGPDDLIDGLPPDRDEAGFYVVHDLTEPGPHDVVEVLEVGGMWRDKLLYYPSGIQTLEPRPLVVISHGAGHDFRWYGYLARHLASYGYVVMTHENDIGPGPDGGARSTIGNTDDLLARRDELAGGVLADRIDARRIAWVGHSRGGEGVVVAIHRLISGQDAPLHFGAEDVGLVIAMAPSNFLGKGQANVHDVPLQIFTGSGDLDVDGSAACGPCQTFGLHDRATGARYSTILQGAGHEDFHDEPLGSAEGACPISQGTVHLVVKAQVLAAVSHTLENNVPASDFLWRQFERFRPIGVDVDDPCVVVSHEYRPDREVGIRIVDDFQQGTSRAESSAGDPVTFSVSSYVEGRLDDRDFDFVWRGDDPFNGATQAGGRDGGRGVVFEWDGQDRYVEWQLGVPRRDFRPYTYLSFRAAQGTQHPLTRAQVGDLHFSVRLRDVDGTSRSIDFGVYGGGLEEPYDRQGGWHNEMETVRIRLSDFGRGGDGPRLDAIAAVRLDVGPSWGSSEGRVVFGELLLTGEAPPLPLDVDWSIDLVTEVAAEDRIAVRTLATAPESGIVLIGLALLLPEPVVVTLWSAPMPKSRTPIATDVELPSFVFDAPVIVVAVLVKDGVVQASHIEFAATGGTP